MNTIIKTANKIDLSKLIVENSHDGIMIIGDDYIIEFVNNQLCEIIGYSQMELFNKDFRELLIFTEKKDVIEKYDVRLAEMNLNSTFEMPVIINNNKRKIFEIKNTLFTDSEGSKKILSQFKDITARKKAEETIKQSEKKFRSIVEYSHLGILMVDMNYRMEYVNDQFCKMVKVKKEELEGMDFRKYLAKESLELTVNCYRKRQQGLPVPSEYEIILLTSDGEEKIARLSSTIVNISGNITTIAQILDITEEVKKEKLQTVILNISQAVNEINNLSDFLGIVRNELSKILDTKNFYVAMYDRVSDTYTFPYHVDEFDLVDNVTQIELKDGLTDYVRRNNKAILVNQKIERYLNDKGEIKGLVGKSASIWLGVPLVVDNIAVGVICLQNYHNAETFNEGDLKVLKIISENVSSAIWKKQIIDKLTESEWRYRDFIIRSSEGIYRIDFDPPIDINLPKDIQVKQIFRYGTFGECNKSFLKMYGFKSLDDLIGKNLNVFYNNSISETDLKSFIGFIDDYRTTDVETNEITAKGENLNILTNSIGIIKDKHLHNIWGIKKDITESKKLQNVLQQIAKGFSSLIGDSFFKSLVQFLGETLKIDYALIVQLSEDKKCVDTLALWGQNKFIDNISYPLKNTPCKVAIENKKITLIDNVLEEFPNDQLLVKLNVTSYMGIPLINSDGKSIGIIVILNTNKFENIEFTKSVLEIFASRSSAEIERLQYVKEIVEAKEEAERSNNLKSDFLAQMSHEIRTPVNTILNFTSLLKESLECQLEDDLKDSFKIIESGGQRLIRTIDLILNVSQIQTGSLVISPTKINLIGILENLISEFKQSAHIKNLELNFESEKKEINIFGDSYTITQIFANLIHNAIKYTASGKVEVIAKIIKKKEIIVEVSDTGVGMSDEYLTKIFEPFSQEETGYTRKFEGTGLGLTLVRKYCELNNAEIFVNSKKNEGTTFIIKIKTGY